MWPYDLSQVNRTAVTIAVAFLLSGAMFLAGWLTHRTQQREQADPEVVARIAVGHLREASARIDSLEAGWAVPSEPVSNIVYRYKQRFATASDDSLFSVLDAAPVRPE